MPYYNYECKQCGVFEVKRPINTEPLKRCPSCGDKVRKLISKPAIIYNCAGFYATDNKKDKE